jgi:hypothetical protein
MLVPTQGMASYGSEVNVVKTRSNFQPWCNSTGGVFLQFFNTTKHFPRLGRPENQQASFSSVLQQLPRLLFSTCFNFGGWKRLKTFPYAE